MTETGPLSETWHVEGKARFQLGNAFYRPKSKRVRDLGVLAATVLRQQNEQLHVLDAFTGCGIRSLRYGLESDADALWINDGNPLLQDLIRGNLRANNLSDRAHVSFLPLQRLLARLIDQEQRFDWVDLDCFGTPINVLPMAIAVTKIGGCLYVTATDGKSLSGQQSSQALRSFNAYTRHHPAVHEQGVRVLAGMAIHHARQQGFNLEPLFSFFCGQTYRVLLRLQEKSPAADQDYGFLSYCHHCGQFQTLGWRSLAQVHCLENKEHKPIAVSGPMWLGNLHCSTFVEQMAQVAQQWGWREHFRLLQIMQNEVSLPAYYYPLSELGTRGRMDIPPRELLIQTLQKKGFQACKTSLLKPAIKTNASFSDLLRLAKGLSWP